MSGLFEERCQFENTVYRYLPPLGVLRRVRRGLRRLPDRYRPRRGLGKLSRFAPGQRVRVLDADGIRATLDRDGKLRGLSFTAEQWAYCGGSYDVDTVVQRLMDDGGLMRPISRSVTLAGVCCDGVHRNGGCGRACPLIFRDEWLAPEPAERQPETGGADEAAVRYARVRSVAEIAATLDRSQRRDGVLFWRAMERYAGARFVVRKAVQPLAATWWRRPGADWYILEGVQCTGELLNGVGPCHRGCGLLWHRDWLDFEENA